MTKELKEAKEEIERLKARIAELESRPAIFPDNKEPDLYPGEITDYLTELVQFAASNAHENTRRSDICRALVGWSVESPMEARQKIVANALKDYRIMTPEIKEKLEKVHIKIETQGARHLLSLAGDNRYRIMLTTRANSSQEGRFVAHQIGTIFF